MVSAFTDVLPVMLLAKRDNLPPVKLLLDSCALADREDLGKLGLLHHYIRKQIEEAAKSGR